MGPRQPMHPGATSLIEVTATAEYERVTGIEPA
jgi:hypothetical protein